ncbi:MAG: hypothetical protein V7K89_31290 [Nostoc sp.]|uniref:hypothetical protein n=1 Tax=Nostoc sp. TaxID=1180 RepID=UPI002FFBD28C
MFNQLPMPCKLSQLATEGYAKHGRGFVYWVWEVDKHDSGKYSPATDCFNFNVEPNTEYLKQLLQTYDPIVEFVLFINIDSQGSRSHLYPRLIPLSK